MTFFPLPLKFLENIFEVNIRTFASNFSSSARRSSSTTRLIARDELSSEVQTLNFCFLRSTYSYDQSSHTHHKQATGFHVFLSHPNYDLVPFTAFSQAFSDKAAVFLQFPEVKIQNLDILKFNYATAKSTKEYTPE